MADPAQRFATLATALAELGVQVDDVTLEAVARSVQAAIEAGEPAEDAIRHGAIQLLAAVRCSLRASGPDPTRGARKH